MPPLSPPPLLARSRKAPRTLNYYFPPGDLALRVLPQEPQEPTGRHSHDFEELVLITGGRGIHFTDSESYPIAAGDVFVIHTPQGHGYRDTADLRLLNILYRFEDLQLPHGELRKLPGYHALFCLEPQYREQHHFESRLRLTPAELAAAVELVARLQAELGQKAPGYEFMGTACFMQLIGFLSRRYVAMTSRVHTPLIHLGQVISHLENHYAEPIGVAALCRIAHLSRSTLFRAFRRSTGLTPLEYLIRLRVRRAGELLRHSQLAIKEIAAQTGFRDSNYFSRQYRRVTGESPRATRHRHGAG